MDDFLKLGCREMILQALVQQGITKPTAVGNNLAVACYDGAKWAARIGEYVLRGQSDGTAEEIAISGGRHRHQCTW